MVALQGLDAGTRRRDQVVHDRPRDVVRVERRFERRRVPAGARVEPVALADRVIERGVRVQVGGVRPVVAEERCPPVRLITVGGENGAVLPVGQGHVRARAQLDRRKLGVGH
jgi:hypothetical protein